MIDEERLAEILRRRADAIQVSPPDASTALRRGRRRLARTGIVGLAGAALLILSVATIHAGDRSERPITLNTPPPTPRITPSLLPRASHNGPLTLFGFLGGVKQVRSDGTQPPGATLVRCV